MKITANYRAVELLIFLIALTTQLIILIMR